MTELLWAVITPRREASRKSWWWTLRERRPSRCSARLRAQPTRSSSLARQRMKTTLWESSTSGCARTGRCRRRVCLRGQGAFGLQLQLEYLQRLLPFSHHQSCLSQIYTSWRISMRFWPPPSLEFQHQPQCSASEVSPSILKQRHQPSTAKETWSEHGTPRQVQPSEPSKPCTHSSMRKSQNSHGIRIHVSTSIPLPRSMHGSSE